MTYDLDFQSAASCGHNPHMCKKINVNGQLVQELEEKQTDGHDRSHYLACQRGP